MFYVAHETGGVLARVVCNAVFADPLAYDASMARGGIKVLMGIHNAHEQVLDRVAP